jgi:hypothetical protein
MTKITTRLPLRLLLAGFLASCFLSFVPAAAQNQQLAFAGLRSVATQGQFNAVQSDSSGDLYLLLDQKDGVRVLKTDPAATTVLAQAQLGAHGDIGLSMALDPTGNVYVTGTTTSGSLTSTAGAAFPAPTSSSTNSFIAKFDASLNPIFVTFAGSGHMATASIAATATSVFITGSIFSSTLPITPSAIIQTPASGSSQNGFVEKFNSIGTTLLYATYLSGASGDTAPAAIAADPNDNAYIAGYTSAPGYPTLAAVVPEIIPASPGSTSGFLTKLTPNGDGILFSTFIPGSGLTSIAYDPSSQNLLLSGSIALGDFPVATVPMPLVPTTYQTLLRMPLDGSTVLSSTLIAPGTQSFAVPAPSGSAWITGTLTAPLLPLTTLSTLGNTFAAHVTQQSIIDQTARFGGLPTTNPTYSSVPVAFTSLTTNLTGQPIFAGSVAPTASSSLLSTETYDLPHDNTPTAALPSTLRNAVPAPGTCNGSLCSGYAAYLAKLNTTTAAPALVLSSDDAPNLTLRNLGSAPANALQLSASNFTITNNCPTTLPAAAECSIALTGSGPGTITLQAANATTQTINIPAVTTTATPIVFSPKELDFGIQTSTSKPATRTITVTNLTQFPQSFTSALAATTVTPYTLTEQASDCPTSGLSTNKLLAPGGICHITLALAASSNLANDGFLQTQWSIGSRSVLLTGYTQAAALNTSAPQIDFGTYYIGAPRLPRYLYLSNSSDTAIPHAPVNLVATSPFTVTDRCPTTLIPHSVCQLQLDYQSTQPPSFDATTLTLDQGLSVLVTGRTLPQPGANGSSINPNLAVTPTSINFPNAVVVTATSSTTQNITIGNTGTQPFTLALALTGDFTDSTNCPTTLPGGATCAVILTFAPSQPGTRQGLLTVTAGSNTTPIFVTLSGTGTPILTASNGSIDFGSIIVGQPSVQWYKISQPFSQFTATTNNSDFTAILVEDIGYGHGQPPSSAFSSTATGSCTNCWLGIQFKPSAVGPQTATLTLSSSATGTPSPLTLLGTGLPLTGLILTPVSQDFGPIPIHSTSTTALFTLTNLTSNSTPITITAPAITGDFTLSNAPTGGPACTGTLAVNASCFLQIDFAPTTSGPRAGTLTLQTSAGTVTSSLNGYGSPDPGLSLNPTALIFHNVPGATATQQTITLTNTSNTPLQIATPTVTTSSFQSTSNCSTLAPAATCTITVTFTPTIANAADTLQIPVSSTAANTTYTVPLSGAYTTEDASLQIISNETNFGPTPTSTLGITRQFTINNLTAKSLYLNIALPRQFVLSGPPCSGLAPNASCNFSVTFLPLTNGDITGTLFAQANPTDGSPTLNALGYVEGYGLGANSLTITGNLIPGGPLNFGQVSSGQSASQTLTLTNNTASTITVRRITTEWPFLSTSTCGSPLALHQSCTVTITYNPLNQAATGTTSPLSNTDAGTLVIESDALSSPEFIDLAGSAAPILVASPSNAAPLISYTASQSSLTFPTTLVGNVSASQTVTLANTGTTTLHITNLQTTPDFTVSSACTTIVPGASCNLIVAFTPQSPGTRIGALEITSDASSSLDFISLIGAADPSFLALAPAALDFGTVLVGSSTTLPLQITNTAATPVTFNTITATGDYSVTGNCLGTSLPAASSCNLQITFTPTQSGTRTGALSIASSTSTLPLTAALTGIGAQSHLQITPSTLNFGSITLGASANISLTLANTGNAAITNLALSLPTGDFAITTPCALTALAPGASCSVTLTFTPTVIGARTSTLAVTTSATTSPDLVPLTGTGLPNGTFTLTVGSPTATVQSGHPATYNLAITPQNNFSGTVVLNCTPITPAPFATCSLLPSSITLTGASQNAIATINTVTSVNLTAQQRSPRAPRLGSAVLCLLTPALFFFWRGHTRLPNRPTLWITLFTAAVLTTLLAASGCGSGGDPTLRFSSPGTYQYQVTASSTSGVQITQSVTLNVTVQPR